MTAADLGVFGGSGPYALLEGGAEHAVTMEEVFAVMADNNDRVGKLLFRAVDAIPVGRSCSCEDGAGGLTPEPPTSP